MSPTEPTILKTRGPAELLAVVPSITGFTYTDTTFHEQRGIPHLELWRTLETRLRRAGFRIVESCCVAADGWASYLDRRRPREGHPLHLIRENPAALEAASHAGVVADISVLCELRMRWARGALSPASAMLDLAAGLDPELRMVDTLGMLLASGPPQWAYDHHREVA